MRANHLLLTDADIQRFWTRVGPPDDAGHMMWKGKPQANGYGRLGLASGKYPSAHRVSCQIAYGPPEDLGMQAAHECRKRLCVAPAHIRWKTARGNQQDRFRDGTSTRATESGVAKLAEAQVLAILQDQRPHKKIASEYGLYPSTVQKIKSGKTWSHITGALPTGTNRGERQGMHKLTEEQVLNIYRSNERADKLAETHHVSKAQIYRIKSGATWSWLTGTNC